MYKSLYTLTLMHFRGCLPCSLVLMFSGVQPQFVVMRVTFPGWMCVFHIFDSEYANEKLHHLASNLTSCQTRHFQLCLRFSSNVNTCTCRFKGKSTSYMPPARLWLSNVVNSE